MSYVQAAPILSPIANRDGVVAESTWIEWFRKVDSLLGSSALTGALLAVNNLSDVVSVALSRNNLGLGVTNSPTLADLTLTALTASSVIGTDGSKKLVSLSSAALAAILGLGPLSVPTFAGLTLDALNGVLYASYGTVGVLGIGSSLHYIPGSLNTVQDIRTSASPMFAGLTDTGLTASLPVFSDSTKKLASKSISDTRTFLGIEQAIHVAGETVSGHRVVRIDASDQAWYADNTAPADVDAIYGLTLGAALVGGNVLVQYFGPITEPSWTWTTASPLFLTASGMLSHTPPVTGFLLTVGFALTPTKIMFNPKMPIVLV